MADRHDTTLHERVNLMKIGGTFTVLFAFSCHAIDESERPVEILMNNGRLSKWFRAYPYRVSLTLIKMVARGSRTLVYGQRKKKGRTTRFQRIREVLLEEFFQIHASLVATAETNIIQALAEMNDQVMALQGGEASKSYEMDFTTLGELTIKPAPPGVVLLLHKDLMQTLLSAGI